MLLKHNDNVIFCIKTVYFFIHLKNVIIAFPFFSSVSLFSLLVVMVRFLRITIFLLNKIVIVRKRSFFHKYKELNK